LRHLVTWVLLLLASSATAAGLEPVVFVYTGGAPELAEMLAPVIESDGRIEGRVMILQSPGEVVLAAAMPTTKCIVVYANHKDFVTGLGTALVPFFKEGGGIVGMTEVCYEPSALALATEVFPVFANFSATELSLKERRTRTYIPEEASEIASGLPDGFEILSMGTYLSADENGDHVRVPGDYTVVYRDNKTGSPLLLAHESAEGGRSVAFPGIMLVSIPRLDVYYGNLVKDQNFVKLFTNYVAWAADNGRIGRVEEGLTDAIAAYDDYVKELKDEAERSRRDRAGRRVMILIGLWAVGLLSVGLVVLKIVRSSGE
jgi:hypothetical protein